MLAGFSKLAGPSGTASAAVKRIVCGFPDGRDGRSPAHSPPTRRIGPSITTADFRRIVVCTLLVAASYLPESVGPVRLNRDWCRYLRLSERAVAHSEIILRPD